MASWGQTWARPMFFCLVCCIPPLGASPALPDMSSRETCKPLVSFIFSSHMTNPSLRSSHILLTQPAPGYSIPHSQPLYGSALNRFRLWPIYHWGPWAALAVVMVGGIVAFRGCLETGRWPSQESPLFQGQQCLVETSPCHHHQHTEDNVSFLQPSLLSIQQLCTHDPF